MGWKTVQFVWFVMCRKMMWSFILSFVHHSLIGKGNEKVLHKRHTLMTSAHTGKRFRSPLVVYVMYDRWSVCHSWFLCVTHSTPSSTPLKEEHPCWTETCQVWTGFGIWGDCFCVFVCDKGVNGWWTLCTMEIGWRRWWSDAADSLQLEKCHHSRKTTQEKDYIFKST